jgi:hypothetical protein
MKYVLALVLLVTPLTLWAAATMQNDSESIALPTSEVGGVQQPIFDNPDLIQEWIAGANPNTDYYSSLGAAFLVTPTGGITVVVGNPNTDAGAAFAEYLGSDSGLFFNSTPSVGSIGVTQGGNGVVITGSKLREALKKKGILTFIVEGWDFDDSYYLDDSEYYASLASLDTSDLAVLAAGVVFHNQNIEEVSIVGNTISITYTAEGWLFGLVPINFIVALSINANGTSDAERVSLTYPWYRIFVWLPISPNELAANLNAAIVGIQAAGLDPTVTQARLFTYVGSVLGGQGATNVTGIPR